MERTLRERALRLLARREHSRVELARKLGRHAESGEQLETLLDDLVARRLLSDERYVEMRIAVRRARFGNARLERELRTQGICCELADEALASAESEHPEIDRARELWRRKFGRRAGVAGEWLEPATAAEVRERREKEAGERARQIRFLMSRGFSAETIRAVLGGGELDNCEDE